MTKLSKAKVETYLLLFLAAVLLSALFFIDGFAKEKLPEIYEMKAADRDNGFVTFGELDDLNYMSACAYKEIDAFIEKNGQAISGIKTVLTDSNYCEMYNLSMIAGEFFSIGDSANNRQYVIIPDTLSLKLYLRNNPIGEEINIDGYSYTVLGVYEDDKSFWGSINKDSYDRIYIPAAGYNHYERLEADAVSFMNNERLFENIDTLLAEYPHYVSNYAHYNYIEKSDFATQAVPILLFTLQIIIIIFILRIIYKTTKLIFDKMRGYEHDEYLGGIIRMHKKDLIFLGVFIFLNAALIILLANTLKFPVIIPVAAIPDENLFDVNHYASKILQSFSFENTADMAGNKYHYLLSGKTFLAELILLTYIFPTLIILCRKIKKLNSLDYVSFIEASGYSALISIIIILLISFIFHTVSKQYVYTVLSLLGFLALVFINHNIDRYNSVIEFIIKVIERF